jgi:MinD superfamily P-loop ATPase
VSPLTISCETCGRSWAVASPYSVYEQQAVESCPCPHCGACTLCCPDPAQRTPQQRARRGKPLQTAVTGQADGKAL